MDIQQLYDKNDGQPFYPKTETDAVLWSRDTSINLTQLLDLIFQLLQGTNGIAVTPTEENVSASQPPAYKIVLFASGAWTASYDNTKLSIDKTSGAAGITSITVTPRTNTGSAQNVPITFTLTGTTETAVHTMHQAGGGSDVTLVNLTINVKDTANVAVANAMVTLNFYNANNDITQTYQGLSSALGIAQWPSVEVSNNAVKYSFTVAKDGFETATGESPYTIGNLSREIILQPVAVGSYGVQFNVKDSVTGGIVAPVNVTIQLLDGNNNPVSEIASGMAIAPTGQYRSPYLPCTAFPRRITYTLAKGGYVTKMETIPVDFIGTYYRDLGNLTIERITADDFVESDKTYLQFVASSAPSQAMTVSASGPWAASAQHPETGDPITWLHCTPMSGGAGNTIVMVTADDNDLLTPRPGIVHCELMSNPDIYSETEVLQSAPAQFLTVDPDTINLGASANLTRNISVNASGSWRVRSITDNYTGDPAEWLHINPNAGSSGVTESVVSADVNLGAQRMAWIEYALTDSQLITFTQMVIQSPGADSNFVKIDITVENGDSQGTPIENAAVHLEFLNSNNELVAFLTRSTNASGKISLSNFSMPVTATQARYTVSAPGFSTLTGTDTYSGATGANYVNTFILGAPTVNIRGTVLAAQTGQPPTVAIGIEVEDDNGITLGSIANLNSDGTFRIPLSITESQYNMLPNNLLYVVINDNTGTYQGVTIDISTSGITWQQAITNGFSIGTVKLLLPAIDTGISGIVGRSDGTSIPISSPVEMRFYNPDNGYSEYNANSTVINQFGAIGSAQADMSPDVTKCDVRVIISGIGYVQTVDVSPVANRVTVNAFVLVRE